MTVENRSKVTWPGFRPAPELLVHVGLRWLDTSGREVEVGARPSRIPTDIQPGERVRVAFAVQPPRRPGPYRLRVTLVQLGGPWFDQHGGPWADAEVTVGP